MTIAPIFILGNPRSGTTLLRIILNAHEELVLPPEFGFAAWLYDDFHKKNFKNKNTLNHFLEMLEKTRKFETWEINVDELRMFLLEYIKNGSYVEIVDLVYQYYGYSKEIKFNRWGDKNNFYIDYIDKLIDMFPNAQFIHIVRDGRDVACSYIELSEKKITSKYKPVLSADIHDVAEEWHTNNEMIRIKLKDLASENRLLIRYEDLIMNFRSTVDKLLDFLNLAHDERMLGYYNTKSYEPNEFLQWKEKVNSKPDRSRVGRYKQDLSQNQINTFNRIAKDSLNLYKYL